MLSHQKRNHIVVGVLLALVLVTGAGLTAVIAQSNPGDTESVQGFLDATANTGGYSTDPALGQVGIAVITARIVRTFINFVGVIFNIFVIYGGFLWLTAAGNDDKIDKAKSIIRDGVIGIIVVIMALGIYAMVLGIFSNAILIDSKNQRSQQQASEFKGLDYFERIDKASDQVDLQLSDALPWNWFFNW